jgi:hypothetical protein
MWDVGHLLSDDAHLDGVSLTCERRRALNGPVMQHAQVSVTGPIMTLKLSRPFTQASGSPTYVERHEPVLTALTRASELADPAVRRAPGLWQVAREGSNPATASLCCRRRTGRHCAPAIPYDHHVLLGCSRLPAACAKHHRGPFCACMITWDFSATAGVQRAWCRQHTELLMRVCHTGRPAHVRTSRVLYDSFRCGARGVPSVDRSGV